MGGCAVDGGSEQRSSLREVIHASRAHSYRRSTAAAGTGERIPPPNCGGRQQIARGLCTSSQTDRERLRPEPEGVKGSCQTVVAVPRLRLAVPAVATSLPGFLLVQIGRLRLRAPALGRPPSGGFRGGDELEAAGEQEQRGEEHLRDPQGDARSARDGVVRAADAVVVGSGGGERSQRISGWLPLRSLARRQESLRRKARGTAAADYADYADCSRAGTLPSRNEPGFLWLNGLGRPEPPEAVHKQRRSAIRWGGGVTAGGALRVIPVIRVGSLLVVNPDVSPPRVRLELRQRPWC